ncbi:MAG: D-2-hydroxyacid dehydrogenase [Acuticoccus sp.]
MTIYVALDLTLGQREALERIAGPVTYGPDDGETLPEALAAAEIAFGNISPIWLEKAERLKWLQLASVGFGEYGEVLLGPVGGRTTVTNLAGFFDDPVAESILAGILAHWRGIDWATRLRGEKEWLGDAMRPHFRLLRGASVVVFGHGAIGRRLAELLAPFGCRLTTFGSGWQADALDAALGEADIVVSIAPHTPQTAGTFDAARLARIKRGALFVNFGRGSVVEEAALAEALAAGTLGGAVLDVTLDEPLPQTHPFWTVPGLILTQHTAGGTTDEFDRKVAVFTANLTRYRDGAPLKGIVDPAKGY